MVLVFGAHQEQLFIQLGTVLRGTLALTLAPDPLFVMFWCSNSLLCTVCATCKQGRLDSCTACNPLQSSKVGKFSFPLSTPGPKYFICMALSHCLGGMKLLVRVHGSLAQAPGPMADHRDTGPKMTTVEAPSTIFPDPAGKANNNNSPLPGFSSSGLCHSAWDSLPAAGFGLLITLLLLISI